MTDVYLRYITDAEGAKVGEVPFTKDALDEAVRLVQLWSVDSDEAGDTVPFHSANLRLASGGRAYFEIIVGEADA